MGQGSASERPPENAEHPSYVTVYQAAGGHQTMVVWWNPEMGGYEEPWATGGGPYATRFEAVAEAVEWSRDWGLPIKGADAKRDDHERAPSLVETLKEKIPDLIVVDLTPEEPVAVEQIANALGPDAQQSLEASAETDPDVRELLVAAGRELQREHPGYRVFVLETIDVEAMRREPATEGDLLGAMFGRSSGEADRAALERAHMLYPPGWPRCACGDFALDGKATCGRPGCSRA